MTGQKRNTALLSLAHLEAKHKRGETFTASEWSRFDQLVAKIQRAALNRRVNLNSGPLTPFEDRLPLAMKEILEHTVCQSDDRPVIVHEGKGDCSSAGTQSAEGRLEMSPKELIDYADEGCYHEAGHAIVRAYLRMPFVSVTIEFVDGVHAGYTHAVPRFTTTYRDFVGATMFAAAGRVATDILAESRPGMTRFDDSDREDQEFIDAKVSRSVPSSVSILSVGKRE